MAIPRRPVARFRGLAALGLTSIGLTAALAACASGAASSRAPSSSRPTAGRQVSAAALRSACSQVSAVLSDGPDPDADPVGYAEAQILPLGQIRTADTPLRAAIGRLAGAYKAFFASNGSSAAAKQAVAAASKQVNAFCPGAAS
jgi:hypothetical protein